MITPGEDVTRLKRRDSLQDAEMIRDPQCGVYFLKNQGVTVRVQGETLYFCSAACRDSYLKNKQSH
jgi:YHS domain-containing protein